MYPEHVIEAIKADAIERFPTESCGLVLTRDDGELTYVAMPNVASNPREEFHVDERQVLPLVDRLVAIVHSHPNGPDCPSASDMRQQLAWNKPFGLVSTDGTGCYQPFFWGAETPKAPLIGRGFRHGVTDCYALVRDYYAELGINLPEVPRDWEWWNQGDRLYEDYMQKEGFFRIEAHEVREHDGFLAQIRSTTPNHAGIYVGKSQILHHLTSRLACDPTRLSKREPIGPWHRLIAGFWVRHEALK